MKTASTSPRCRRTGASRSTIHGASATGATLFVEPQLVAEVEFTEWTKEGILRHPAYKGLRDDKPARDVVREVAS